MGHRTRLLLRTESCNFRFTCSERQREVGDRKNPQRETAIIITVEKKSTVDSAARERRLFTLYATFERLAEARVPFEKSRGGAPCQNCDIETTAKALICFLFVLGVAIKTCCVFIHE